MSRDVFVWLLAVALIGRNIWRADSGSTNEGQRAYVWSRPLVIAWWQAERTRWAEEEESTLLAWGRLARPGVSLQRHGLKKITATRLGPRSEDYYEAASADSPGEAIPFPYASGQIW